MTTMTHPPLSADAALLIRPSDHHALAALRQLARENGAHVQRGAICLAGVRRTAWLAFSHDGRLLAAVLLDADGADGAASLAPSLTSTTPSTPTAERAPCAQNH